MKKIMSPKKNLKFTPKSGSADPPNDAYKLKKNEEDKKQEEKLNAQSRRRDENVMDWYDDGEYGDDGL